VGNAVILKYEILSYITEILLNLLFKPLLKLIPTEKNYIIHGLKYGIPYYVHFFLQVNKYFSYSKICDVETKKMLKKFNYNIN